MIIPFQKEHLKQMDLDPKQIFGVSQYKQVKGIARTLIKGDNILCSGGIEELWPGVGEAWMILTRHALEHPIAVARRTRQMFPWMIKGYHRVQALVLEDFEAGIRFALMLGFHPEGIMKHYGPNRENYFRYAILE